MRIVGPLIRDSFTLVLSRVDKVVQGYSQWFEWIAEKEPERLLPANKGCFASFQQAWTAFGQVIDRGGVLFASYKNHSTYCFSLWTGLIQIAKWCDTTAIAVELNTNPNFYRLYVALQEKDSLRRKIDLRYNPSEGWYFHEVGERLPFEDAKKLTRRNRRDRFDISDLKRFLSIGRGELVEEGTFRGQSRFYLMQHGTERDHCGHKAYHLSDAEKRRIMNLGLIHSVEGKLDGLTAGDVVSKSDADRPKIKCPDHIAGFFMPLVDWKKWGLEKVRRDRGLSCGDIHCSCGSSSFRLSIEDLNLTVIAVCVKCDRRIVVYDLKQYPGATVLRGPRSLRQHISSKGDEVVHVAVAYEYPDKGFDVGDNLNGISWCIVWCKGVSSNQVEKVIDHETV